MTPAHVTEFNLKDHAANIARMLAENPEGLLCYVDELASLFGSMDAYRSKGGKDRPFWLQAKEGGSYVVNRKTSDRIVAENCAVSILGGIQPAKIGPMANSLAEDGFLQRFLPVFIRKLGDGLDEDTNEALEGALFGIAQNIADSEADRRFRFSPEADAERQALEAFKNRELERPNAAPAFRQWLEKLPNEFGRFSLVFHFVEWWSSVGELLGEPPSDFISCETASRARQYLTEFAFSHARRFYGRMVDGSAADDHARWVAGFILDRNRHSIDERDIYRSYTPLKRADRRGDIVAVMRVLELQGWVVPTKERRGVPTAWRVNPAVHDGRFAAVTERERTRRADVRAKIAQEALARSSAAPAA